VSEGGPKPDPAATGVPHAEPLQGHAMINDILAQVPWLKPFIAWAIAIGLVILVLLLPMYYIVLPLLQRLRADCAQYLQRLRELHASKREERRKARLARLEEFARDHLLCHLDGTSERLWQRTRAALLQPASEIQARLASTTGSMQSFTKSLPNIHERLQGITDAMPQDLQLANNTGTALAQATGALRVAKFAFLCSGFLLFAIICVNTGMLSQIVRDLLNIPQSFKFLNVPLPYVLAFLITCVEAGLGVIHGVFSDTEMREEGVKISIGATISSIGAVGMACVEGFFYSRIMPNRTETVTIPFLNYTLPQTDLFFLWGFLLVMTLFGLGLVCFRMGARVLRGTAITSLRKQLRSLTKQTAQWTSALGQAQSMATNAREAVSTGPTTTAFASDAVERLLAELRTIMTTTPPWACINQQPLGAAEVRHLSSHALLWFLLTVIASALAVLTGMASFPALAAPNVIVLAIAQVIVGLTSGCLFGWEETVVQGAGWQKVTSPQWARILGLVIIGTLTVAYLVLYMVAVPAGITLLWTGNLLVCLLSTACAYQLIPFLGLLGLWTQQLGHLLLTILEGTYRILTIIVLVVATFLVQLATIIAGPILVMKGPRALPQ
jgi:hypothetical protein